MSEDTIHIGFNVDDETFDDNALFENYKKMTEVDRIAARCYDIEKVERLKKEKNE